MLKKYIPTTLAVILIAVLGYIVITYSISQQPPISDFGNNHNALKVVQLDEYINFTCPGCYSFSRVSHSIKERWGDAVKINHIPILFSGQSSTPLRLYYIAEVYNKADAVVAMLYDKYHNEGLNINDALVVENIARNAQLYSEYVELKDADWVNEQLSKHHQQALANEISSTPTIILNGQIKIDASQGIKTMLNNVQTQIANLLAKQSN